MKIVDLIKKLQSMENQEIVFDIWTANDIVKHAKEELELTITNEQAIQIINNIEEDKMPVHYQTIENYILDCVGDEVAKELYPNFVSPRKK